MRIALALIAALPIASAIPMPREVGSARPQRFAELTYVYTAQTVAPVLRAGDVRAGTIIWHCADRRCTTSGSWPRPSVEACASLAAIVGGIASYGRTGAMLGAKQLDACNAFAATPRVQLQKPPSTGSRLPPQAPPPNAGLPALPPGGRPGKRDTAPAVEISVDELSVIGGEVCVPAVSGPPPICVTVDELSVIGGDIAPPSASAPPINIPVEELSVIGE